MQKLKLSLILLLCFPWSIKAVIPEVEEYLQNPFKDIHSQRTIARERKNWKEKIQNIAIKQRLSTKLNKNTEDAWANAFWVAEYKQDKSDIVKNSISKVLATWDKRAYNIKRSTIETAYTLFPIAFKSEISKLLPKISDPKLFAMASYYLINVKDKETLSLIRRNLNKRMKYNKNLSLYGYYRIFSRLASLNYFCYFVATI
jgi:hypothetical protein